MYITRPFVVKNALTFVKGNAMGRESYVQRISPVDAGTIGMCILFFKKDYA